MNVEYKRYGFNVSAFVFGAVLVLLLFRRCGDGGGRIEIRDTIKTVDTFWSASKTDTQYVPKPYKVEVPSNEEIPYNIDSIFAALSSKDGVISKKSDSLSVLIDYLTKRYYYDSFNVQYGKIYISDTVFANSIVGKGVIATFNVPTITKTFTIEAQRRTTLYIGGDMYGNMSSPIYAVGGSIGLKFKNDKMYEVKALLSKEGVPIYGLGFRIPIKTRKN